MPIAAASALRQDQAYCRRAFSPDSAARMVLLLLVPCSMRMLQGLGFHRCFTAHQQRPRPQAITFCWGG